MEIYLLYTHSIPLVATGRYFSLAVDICISVCSASAKRLEICIEVTYKNILIGNYEHVAMNHRDLPGTVNVCHLY